MEGVREYLLSVTAAAVVCSCIGAFFEKKGSIAVLVKTLCGIFVSLTVLRPVLNISLPDMENYISTYSADVQTVTEDAARSAANAQCEVIRQRAESYVYDKAAKLGCDISVCILLSEAEPYEPVEIQIKGKLSPYAKSQLSASITADLGIPEEEQHWNS